MGPQHHYIVKLPGVSVVVKIEHTALNSLEVLLGSDA